jgi:hypothetical protein
MNSMCYRFSCVALVAMLLAPRATAAGSSSSSSEFAGGRIQLTIDTHPIYISAPALESLTLSGANIRPRHPSEDTERVLDVVFDDLPDGEYTLKVDDPLFEPVTLEHLRPGSGRTLLALRGRSAISIHVVDAANGEPIERYGVEALLARESFSRESSRWAKAPAREPTAIMSRASLFELREPMQRKRGGDDVFRAIPPANYTLIVRTLERAPMFVPVPDLRAGEVRKLSVAMVAGGSVSGRVIDPRPNVSAEPVKIALFAPGEQSMLAIDTYYAGEDSYFSRAASLGHGWERAVADVANDGTFRIQHVYPGKYCLRARSGDYRDAFSEVVVEEEADARIEVALPAESELLKMQRLQSEARAKQKR